MCTCSWRDQPAVQKTSCQGIVEDHGPLTVDRLQDVLYGYWNVRVRARRLLTSFLAFDQQIGKGTRSPALGYGQSLIVSACVETQRQVMMCALLTGAHTDRGKVRGTSQTTRGTVIHAAPQQHKRRGRLILPRLTRTLWRAWYELVCRSNRESL